MILGQSVPLGLAAKSSASERRNTLSSFLRASPLCFPFPSLAPRRRLATLATINHALTEISPSLPFFFTGSQPAATSIVTPKVPSILTTNQLCTDVSSTLTFNT